MNKLVRPVDLAKPQAAKSVDELLRGFKSGISYRTLEPRIAFDGAAVATAVAVVDAQDQAVDGASSPATGEPAVTSDATASSEQSDGTHSAADASNDLASAISAVAAPADAAAPATIVYIDNSVENIGQIISSIPAHSEIVIIDGLSSGLDQIASDLAGRSNVGSIHIVSHGETGTLYLGADALTAASLADHQAVLAAIGQSLTDAGDILLYGCEIGNGTGGMDFVRAFSAATGADVAASIDNTGGDEAGGDWVLEATAGSIEASALSNPLYAGLLVKTNTGAWTANGGTPANDWQNTTDGITTTVTFVNGGTSTWNTIANGTLNTAAGGLTATTFDNSAVGATSLSTVWGSTNNTDVGTVTISFDRAVTNPVLHLDRMGGVLAGPAGAQPPNGSLWTLTTSGASLTRLSGTSHFVVNSTTGTITRAISGTTTGTESNANASLGTAAGSVRINGTFTSITFKVIINPAAGAGSGDGMELALAIDAPPTAVNDSFGTIVHDTSATINVRSNDSDIRGDVINVTKINGTAIIAGGPGVNVTGGVVTLNAGGNLIFTPTANYAGTPSFTYTISDANGGEATATVSGTVTNVAPALDLDASGAGTGFTTTYTENGSAVSIADIDPSDHG